MAAGLIGAHFTVTGVPELFGFRVEPNYSSAAFTDIIQNLFFRVGIIGAPVPDDDKGRLFVDNVHVIFLKLPKGETVISRSVVLNVGLL